MSYHIAMQARTWHAPYNQPWERTVHREERLIVSRYRSTRDLLVIARTDAASMSESAAGARREPDVLVGVLAAKGGSNESEVFLFIRSMFEDATFEGRFFPADGYAQIDLSDDRAKLVAVARYAHFGCAVGDEQRLRDEPPETADMSGCLHFEAAHLPWRDELLPNQLRRAHGHA